MKRNKLNDNLRLLLDLHEMTETQLAKELKIANTTFHRILNDDASNPNISSLRPIAKHFSVTIDQLIGDSPLFINSGEKIEIIRHTRSLIPVLNFAFQDLKNTEALLKSIDSSNWHHWVSTPLPQTEHCFAVEISLPLYLPPLYKGSIQVISASDHYHSGDICLIIDNQKRHAGFKKILFEGDVMFLVNIYSLDQSVILQNPKEQPIIGKVIQSIINHEVLL